MVTQDGSERRIGYELEFAGLTVDEAAQAVANSLGGRVVSTNRFQRHIEQTCIGDVRVELDTSYLKQERYVSALESVGIRRKDIRKVEDVLETVAQSIVPCEVVTDPVPISQQQEVETLREALQNTKAAGTNAHVAYAFGLHLNPEVASTSAQHLCSVLASFLLVYEWIVDTRGVDWSRRITPFIDPFPSQYVEKVINPDYAPDLETLVEDYLEANPTRNRALDMLPVFTQLAPDRVRSVIADPAVKARPAFHYRLPDCRIDERAWRIAHAIEPWTLVERIANNSDLRHRMAEGHRKIRQAIGLGRRAQWVAHLDEILNGC